ncbi:helix-turn-helix domain-containing protein [Oceanobacillus bengalensis]|uniref:XRE family transcriptional regulator n=1 Tax=Oceanobacillus bengalensis TaxID=1435466 RepID=A0A494YU80_9BACI|nr:helix-turn-helix transcriptional regulator [Oceanobacillus bengalensis]RKQ13706.1 XRE family transcriptional regulator [Oceanobacillus bengalensis]
MDAARIGRRIKAFRKLKGYTQIDFAREVGLSITLIGNIERGTREVNNEILVHIAAVLGISEEELIVDGVNKNGY